MAYNPDGLDRGAEFPLSADQREQLDRWMAHTVDVVRGILIGVAFTQENAFEPSQESMRDELIHRLSGQVFDVDVDGALSASETTEDYELSEELIGELEFDNPLAPVRATVRRFEDDFRPNGRIVYVTEAEFPASHKRPDSEMIRVIEVRSQLKTLDQLLAGTAIAGVN